MNLIELSETMTKDILAAVGKTDDPVKPIIELYIQKKVNEFLDDYRENGYREYTTNNTK